MVKLSSRLQIVYNMVPKCMTVADVGCDHGYLSISLLENNIAANAICMDVNKGPLDSAKANVKEAGLSDRTQFRLSNGLAGLSSDEADVVCICGMGGALIQRILDAGIDVARQVECLILEPQSEYKKLRQFLMDSGFIIDDENLCTEENKIYPIMKVHYGNGDKINYSEEQLEYGPIIIKNSPSLLKTLLQKNRREYLDIIAKLEKQLSGSSDTPIQTRIIELKHQLELIDRIGLD